MSRENVELVGSLFPSEFDLVELIRTTGSPFGPDRAAFAEDLDVRFISSRLSAAQEVSYTGVEGLTAGWSDWLDAWASYRISIEDVFDAGDEVVTFVRVEARTARDGVAVEHAPAAVWTVRDRKVARVHFYLDRDDALAAAGLEK